MDSGCRWSDLYVVFYGFGCPAVNIVSPLVANHMFGDKEVGSFIGYINMFISVGGAISGIVVGQLFDATGGYTIPFIVCSYYKLYSIPYSKHYLKEVQNSHHHQ